MFLEVTLKKLDILLHSIYLNLFKLKLKFLLN